MFNDALALLFYNDFYNDYIEIIYEAYNTK